MDSYEDVRTVQSGSAKSYIPKEKWNANDIEKYTINSVWDSGITQISKPKVSKDVINYEGALVTLLLVQRSRQ